MLSLFGVVLALAVFVYFVFKNVKVLILAPLVSVLVLVMSGMNPLEFMTTVYMSKMSGFLKAYWLIFLLSAIFGKLISDSGAARRIALTIAGYAKKSEKNKKFMGVCAVPILYAILSYSGISLFVLVFTIVAIAKDLFEELDIPWHLYGCGGIGSATITMLMLPGSPQIQNVIPTKYFGTTVMAAPALGIVSSVIMIVFAFFYIRMAVGRCEKRGEKFIDTGSEIAMTSESSSMDENLPPLWKCVLPLFVPIVCIAGFDTSVVVALGCAVVFTSTLLFSHFKGLINTLNTGAVSAGIPLLNIACVAAFGAIVIESPGFKIILDSMEVLPGILQPILIIFGTTALVGSASSGLSIALPIAADKFIDAGLSAEVAHRIAAMSASGGGMPHSAGMINTLTITKLTHSTTYRHYFIGTCVLPTLVLVIAVTLVKLGIFV